MARIVWVCSECGSQQVTMDALVRWNATDQLWDVEAVWSAPGSVRCDGCNSDAHGAQEREETEEEAEERILREDEEREAALERAADPGPG